MDTSSHFGWAWIVLTLALGIHVIDEALTDFLSVYNPAVESIRRRLPFLPLPTFTFRVWLTGLILAVFLLLAVSPLVFRRVWIMVPLGYLFGLIVLANGIQHIAGSIYMNRLMPGVYSAPLLLICSIYLLMTIPRRAAR